MNTREPPCPTLLEAVQHEYEQCRDLMEADHLREVRKAIIKRDRSRYRALVLMWDCRRYEYLMLFEEPDKAEEAWTERLHPLTAYARGYR